MLREFQEIRADRECLCIFVGSEPAELISVHVGGDTYAIIQSQPSDARDGLSSDQKSYSPVAQREPLRREEHVIGNLRHELRPSPLVLRSLPVRQQGRIAPVIRPAPPEHGVRAVPHRGGSNRRVEQQRLGTALRFWILRDGRCGDREEKNHRCCGQETVRSRLPVGRFHRCLRASTRSTLEPTVPPFPSPHSSRSEMLPPSMVVTDEHAPAQ